MQLQHRRLEDLRPCPRNARKHDDRQIDLIGASIRQFGFVNPILVDSTGQVVAGHGRYAAARRLGLGEVPTVLLDHLSEAQLRAYRILDNRLAELSSWDTPLLRMEIGELVEMELEGKLEFDLGVLGFETAEIDVLLDEPDAGGETEPEEVELPGEEDVAVSRMGDLWTLGRHRLLCGDALQSSSYDALMAGEMARMVFCDPPYNVRIRGHVSGTGRHREFAMASGEMSTAEFRNFLSTSLGAAADRLVDGGLLYVCMDWRHLQDLLTVGEGLGFGLVNLCVWVKTSGGMGSLYRSQHELVAVFRKGSAAHLNNVQLGRHGRYRTNCWHYAGVNAFRRGRKDDLRDHPTVKPTPLVTDAIRDVTRHGDLVLDGFGGSGTTLLAAEKSGRCARLIEIDPLYVDTTIRRWQALTGQTAIHAPTGEGFDQRAVAARGQKQGGEHGRQQ